MTIVSHKMNKKIDEMIKYSEVIFTLPLTRKDIIQRLNENIDTYGEEQTILAFENELKKYKAKYKEHEKKQWNKVKSELFEKYKSVPVSIRDIKNEILAGSICIKGLPSEQWIRQTLQVG